MILPFPFQVQCLNDRAVKTLQMKMGKGNSTGFMNDPANGAHLRATPALGQSRTELDPYAVLDLAGKKTRSKLAD
jgi:hypothetical protein